MANSPFAIANYEKTVLTEQTSKRIQRIYKQAASDIELKLRTLQLVNPSDSLKKLYFENLLKDIDKSQDSFNRLIQSTVMGAGEASGRIAVEAGAKVLKDAGLTLKGAYSYVPREEMAKIASGKLYGDKWSLSQAIWKNGLRTKSDIQNVVAKGLAENKSVKDIADDLVKYVDPSARKPWDWNKVYPGTAAKVDYNAQRLARTMIQHSFQSCLVASQRYNPFCKGIIWHSVGLHGRTCEQCLERDGQLFPVKELPLDHPNGMCYFEPELDSMDSIADRLGDWVNGGSDPGLDTYVAKAFNINPKSPEGKKAVSSVKGTAKKAANKPANNTAKKAAGKSPPKLVTRADKEAFVDENFDNLKKRVLQSQTTKERGEEIWKALREKMVGLEGDHLRYMKTGQKKLTAIIPSKKQAFFTPGKWSITMDLEADFLNKHGKGAFTTFFHEYGHLLDYAAVGPKHKYYFTDSSEFRKELYFSLKKEYNKLCIDGRLNSAVRRDLLKSDASNGVQDIISGVSLNKNRVAWGHDTEYWKAKDAHRGEGRGVVLETMAHFNAALADPKAKAYFKKYFPESYKKIEKRLAEYLKGVK